MTTPYIDPNVMHVPISYLRKLNFETLRQENKTLVIDGFDGEEPLSVIIPYRVFLRIQEELKGGDVSEQSRSSSAT